MSKNYYLIDHDMTNTTHIKTIFTLLGLFFFYSAQAAHQIDIKIEGIEGKLLENVLSFLQLNQQKDHPRLNETRIKKLHEQAQQDIVKALEPFGYYHAQVNSDLSNNVETNKTIWTAKYHVALGKPVTVSNVNVEVTGEGKKEKLFQNLLQKPPVKAGDVLDHSAYEKIKQSLKNIAEELGYFQAQLTQHRVELDKEKKFAAIFVSFETGNRYQFGNIQFIQEEYEFTEDFLSRFQTFKPGDAYSATALFNFESTLNDSNYFSQVRVETQRTKTAAEPISVQVYLTPRKASGYTGSVGYGTDTGARGKLEWERRYLNSYGHRFLTQLEWSEIRKSAIARYFIPLGQSEEDFLTVTAAYNDQTTDTSSSKMFLTGVSRNHLRTVFNGLELQEIVGLEYRDEKYTIAGESGHAKLLMPNIAWTYLDTDNRIYASRGYKIQLSVRGSLDGVGSNTSLVQTRANVTGIRKITDSGRIILRGDVGYTTVSTLIDKGEFAKIPPSIRFFAGGDRSVRGYDYESLGPKSHGQVVGGKNLLVGSVEYEHTIIEKWGVAVFSDMGNAFNNFSEELKVGAGAGIRWQSPVGLIRVDVAAALSEEDYPLRLHITIGPDF